MPPSDADRAGWWSAKSADGRSGLFPGACFVAHAHLRSRPCRGRSRYLDAKKKLTRTANYVELLEDDAADLAAADDPPAPPPAPPAPPMPGRPAVVDEPEPALSAHALYAYTKDEANECALPLQLI